LVEVRSATKKNIGAKRAMNGFRFVLGVIVVISFLQASASASLKDGDDVYPNENEDDWNYRYSMLGSVYSF